MLTYGNSSVIIPNVVYTNNYFSNWSGYWRSRWQEFGLLEFYCIPTRKKFVIKSVLLKDLHGWRFCASSELCFFVKSLIGNKAMHRSTDWPLLTFHRKLFWECCLRAVQFFKKINIFCCQLVWDLLKLTCLYLGNKTNHPLLFSYVRLSVNQAVGNSLLEPLHKTIYNYTSAYRVITFWSLTTIAIDYNLHFKFFASIRNRWFNKNNFIINKYSCITVKLF